ncbi:VOC family protein [Filobacillus milosensis]|nr:VOC family protein [Filobacillus milosensis]
MIAFDHLVIYSNDPVRHQEIFSSSHNQVGVPGGKHSLWGTFNHLAFYKNNAYIEWLGIENDEQAEQSDNPLIQHAFHSKSKEQEGPIQFALRINNMDDYLNYFNEKGIEYDGPFPGQRTRPDGSVLEWKMLFPKYNFDAEPLPFLIEWNGEGNIPTDEADLNPSEFNNVTIHSQNPEAFASRMQEIYQLGDPMQSKSRYEWPLENGKLFVSKGRGIEARFKFNLIKFKSSY